MGGCATKPKVSKGAEGEIPAPSLPKEAVPEVEKAVEGENKVETAKDRDVTDDNIDDDQSNKRRSLSNLFEEKEHQGTAESDNTQSEETLESLPQELLETVKEELVPPPVTKNQETKEPEKLAEPASLSPGNAESVQSNQAEPAPEAATTAAVVGVPETQNRETPAGETKDETLVGN
ncbi:hypothetical protein GQ457_02G017390 [Hibiscus cannabinus]